VAAQPTDRLTIGELAARAGVATSTLRYYEREGLIAAGRTAGNQRRYPRHVLRRIAFVRAAQQVGLTLEEVRAALATLPDARTPTKADWARLSRGWRPRLDARIAELEALRSRPHWLHRLRLPVPAPLPALQRRRPGRERGPRCPLPARRRAT